MKKPMIKAMALAMALAMVVSISLPAQAAGLSSLYTTSDAGSNGKKGTGTGTGTGTGVNPEEPGVDEEVKASILGLTLSQTDFALDEGESAYLSATVLLNVDAVDAKGKSKTVAVNALNATEYDNVEIMSDTSWSGNDTEATITPDELLKSVAWKVEDPSILEVKEISDHAEANIKGIAGGQTTVTAYLKGAEEYSAVANVKVTSYSDKLTIVGFPDSLLKGHTYDLNEYLTQDGNDAVTWEISAIKYDSKKDKMSYTNAKSYATVDANGILTAKKATPATDTNEVTLHVKAVSERGIVSNEVGFIVEGGTPAKTIEIDSPKKIAFDFGDNEGTVISLTATAKDAEGETPTDDITWTSSKAGIVDITYSETYKGESTAKIEPLKVGKTTITAKTTSGKKASVTLTVTASVLKAIDGIEISTGNDCIYVGEKASVKAIPDPVQYTGKFTYKLDDSNTQEVKDAVKVSTSGAISFNKKKPITSDTTIKVLVTPKDKNYAETVCLVAEVDIKANGVAAVAIDNKIGQKLPTEKTIYVGKTYDYDATLYDAKLDNKDKKEVEGADDLVVWSTSNKKIATIDSDGVLTPIKSGKVSVTATVYNKDGKAVKDVDKNVVIKTVASKIVIKTPNVIKYESTKDQTVKLSASFPKGFGDAEAVEWFLDDGEGNLPTNFVIKSGDDKTTMSLTIKKEAKAGDKVYCTVVAKNGATATAMVQVCDKVTNVAAVKETEDKRVSFDKKGKCTVELVQGTDIDLEDLYTLECTKAEDNHEGDVFGEGAVSYSAKKKGIVSIKDSIVYGVKPGTVKVTIKAASGKKLDITVNVVERKEQP